MAKRQPEMFHSLSWSHSGTLGTFGCLVRGALIGVAANRTLVRSNCTMEKAQMFVRWLNGKDDRTVPLFYDITDVPSKQPSLITEPKVCSGRINASSIHNEVIHDTPLKANNPSVCQEETSNFHLIYCCVPFILLLSCSMRKHRNKI